MGLDIVGPGAAVSDTQVSFQLDLSANATLSVKAQVDPTLDTECVLASASDVDQGAINAKRAEQPSIEELRQSHPARGDGAVQQRDNSGLDAAGRGHGKAGPVGTLAAAERFIQNGLDSPAFQQDMDGAFFVSPDGTPVRFFHGSDQELLTEFSPNTMGAASGGATT